MEAEAPTSQSATPESLRQRQLNRLSPRRQFAKASRMSTSVLELDGYQKKGVILSPAPRSKPTGNPSPDTVRKKEIQEGLRKQNSLSRRAKREAEDAKCDITPDGGSTGREPRQFAVSNFAHGKIYLRPTIRPANQRYPQPSFVFPTTPPSTAGLDVMASHSEAEELQRDSLWTPTRSPSTPAPKMRNDSLPNSASPPSPSRHRRALSHSTIDEQKISVRDSDAGAFRVVIERPRTGPKDQPFTGIPTLEVPIPSYKLGTPRFSMRGTAFLRGSSCAATDDVRSSVFSQGEAGAHQPGHLSRRHSDASPQTHYPAMLPSSSLGSPLPGAFGQRTAIVPEMFDDLTFKPTCDHASVVRYSIGGGIKAATPARLVAEITSPTFVDYDLLSDFFLSFRSFLGTSDLLCMLIARLKWSIARNDETGAVVRVRTFVAIRHWILNYFLDDYVMDYELRKSFCEQLNVFVNELSQHANGTKVPLKILGELKKCWRRVCALYWDGPEFNTELGPEIPISPGGVAGSRNPVLDPTFWETRPAGPPRLDGIIEPDFIEPETTVMAGRNFFADVSAAGHVDSMISPINMSPVLSKNDSTDQPPLSPTSIMSDDIVSCSFPSRGRGPGAAHPLGAHPVPASSIYDPVPHVATTPKALTGKRVRPAHAHKRSGSFSDSFRDCRPHNQPVQKVLYKSTELLLALPYAGSLVRGNLFPPGQAFVELIAPSTPAEANRATTLFPGTPLNQKGPSAMSGPGMKKLLGSVRRALSTRTGHSPASSPTQGSFPHIPPLGVRGATINRLPGTAIVPQARSRNTGAKAPMRIDLLGAEVAEDFKKAVQEDADADVERQNGMDETKRNSNHSSRHDPALHYSTMCPDTTVDMSRPPNRRAAVSDMTNGSKSIVIVDDTLPLELPVMTGALPANASVDNFGDTYIQPSGGPTPPSTPPEIPLGTPRRSSHLLGEHTRNRSHSFEGTPSLIVDSRPSREEERSPSHRPIVRPTMRSRGTSSFQKKSISLRRYASFHSGFTRHKSERSFDASTFSDSDGVERMSHVPSVPLPLRVLRRRPGGDLRAVTNVGELNSHPLRRPMSTGSIATYSDSVRSSYLLGGDPSDYVDIASSEYDQSQPNETTFSLGALAEASPKPHVSLFSTHSSQPVMRPSFEKEAQMLAQIPDDIDDDGGVESALLKLEGKYEQRHSDISGESFNRDLGGAHNSFGAVQVDMNSMTFGEDEQEKRSHRHNHIVESKSSKKPQVQVYRPPHQQVGEELKPAVYQPRRMDPESAMLSPRSIESYNSIPLLERGFTDDGKSGRNRNWSEHSILRGPSHERHPQDAPTPESSHPNSFNFIDGIDNTERVDHSRMRESHDSVGHSFLNEDSDARSDLSSELSLEILSRADYTGHDSQSNTFPPIRPGTVIKEMAPPFQPIRQAPSSSMTLVQALELSPNATDSPQNSRRQAGKKNFPLTPEVSPTAAIILGAHIRDRGASPSMDPLRSHLIPEASRKTSVHLPFTLAFDSQILAQQFTLIEKDALNEIDWKDLIEMRWKDSPTDSRSWVEFLRTSEPRGVEVVIARFNLMVKWAVSECVLTHDLGERVRCIIKYIHIAAHCRKYRNFATMTQLTIALTSKDLRRLTKTWAHVPASDMRTLKELEALVTPTSNFHSLRAEMEGSGADQGCIPFVGIYTHDLLVNSERPSQIASTPTTEPLVNFEKCRTDATIVKNLLRLLEASQLYRFLPIEGITERCLWMAALTDEEIARYGKMIQE